MVQLKHLDVQWPTTDIKPLLLMCRRLKEVTVHDFLYEKIESNLDTTGALLGWIFQWMDGGFTPRKINFSLPINLKIFATCHLLCMHYKNIA